MSCTVGVVCSTGVGYARGGRARNEDNYLVCRDGRVAWRDGNAERVEAGAGAGTLVAVCDGMGGHADGDVAATAAVRVIAKLWRPEAPADPARALRRFVLESHRRLYERARGDQARPNMGTTLTACWVVGGVAAWAHVGDSRLYLFRDGELRQLTADHTRNEFARRDGRAETPHGHALAQSFIFGSRGLGDDAAVRLDSGRDAGTEPLRPGDVLLLCTDGLWGTLDDAEIAHVLAGHPDPHAAALAGAERAIANGATDNVTALVLRYDGP